MGQGNSTTRDTRDMKKRAKAVHKQADRLIRKGHNCVVLLESYPPQLSWCGKQVCSHPNVVLPSIDNFSVPSSVEVDV